MDVSTTYDRQFFEMHGPWRGEYDLIADTLAALLDFSSAVDLGCGNGFIIARLKSLGKEVRGVDGSASAAECAPPEVRGLITHADLTAPLSVGTFDLAVCTEVAEHLDGEFADALVENVCASSGGLVFFTAATPGQGGHHHVNEQPHEYWIEKFSRRGFEFDRALSSRCREELSRVIHTAWWFTNNAMIFRSAHKNAGGS